jgi:D-alanyl-D-alanine carboxypeptidase
MGRRSCHPVVLRIAVVVSFLGALLLPTPPASAQSPIHPDNRPSGLSGETNGRVRPEALVGVEGDCRAARAAGPSLALMLAAARAGGVALRPGECYRPAAAQSSAKSNACGRGNCACAAGTGTSMHGWGEAVDFRDAGGSLTFSSSGYGWLKGNAGRFGWNHARWAEPGGSACPEAWHWEWVGDGGQMHLDPIRADVVGILACRAGGYWGVTGLGGVVARGGATEAGSAGSAPLAWLVKGGAPTPSGRGYWLVASDGGIFTFGDAGFFGSLGSVRLNRPIVGMAASPSGRGYWLVASDGGVFTFGDAGFFGSLGSVRLNRPIVGMAASPSGRGYWLVASDGGIFSFGDAAFFGSPAGSSSAGWVVAMAATPTGRGYWLASSAGAVYAFGDAVAAGGLTSAPPLPIVGMAASQSGKGYWLSAADGSISAFGDAVHQGGV